MKKVVAITGVSGVGKTTLVNELAKTLPAAHIVHFDDIGIPSEADMIRISGSTAQWQEDTMHVWGIRLAKLQKKHELIIFEGSVDPEFIADAFIIANIANYKIILLDCDELVFQQRLKDRKQSALFNELMLTWKKSLLKKAKEIKCAVFDTSSDNLAEKVKQLAHVIQK